MKGNGVLSRIAEISYVLGMALIFVGIYVYMLVADIQEGVQTQLFVLNPGFGIFLAGIVLPFLAFHALIFAGEANPKTVASLGILYFVWFLMSSVFLSDKADWALWIRLGVYALLVLGVETLVPDWPTRLFRAARIPFRRRKGTVR